jgi:Laminin G domain
MTAQPESEDTNCNRLPSGVPDIDQVAGHWVGAADLAHLPSLRNQFGQGHVNSDLSSLAWLAAPPYAFGYHTGVLRLDGTILPAQRFRWKPWGVQREHTGPSMTVRTDTRMMLQQDTLLWQVKVTNKTGDSVDCTISQDLFAMVAHTTTGWGWLYDFPWTGGNYHDFMTLERIRSSVVSEPASAYLLGPGPRRLRLGKPRLPGIQRDGDTEPMSLAHELPRHVSQDAVYPYQYSAIATIRNIRCRDADRDKPILVASAEIALQQSSEVTLGTFELRAGQLIELELRLDTLDQAGVVLTHGNHPDSLQLGVDAGQLWFGISGEKEYTACELVAGQWHQVTIALDDQRVALSLDGDEVAATSHWSASPRWKSLPDTALVAIADSCSPARASYGFDTVPHSLQTLGAGARAEWALHLEAHQTISIGIACAYGDDALDVGATAGRAAGNFEATLASSEAGYRDLWHSMFTPGNPHFSGHLPALRTTDAGISTSYYMAALLALYMRNTRISASEPIFLTGGPRLGPTTTYFWDHTEWSRLYALLEPAGMRSWLTRALSIPYDRSFGFDTKNGGPLGNRYAANDYALFRLIEHYVCVTGDLAFLDEQAGSLTVLAHLERLAHGWKDKRTKVTGGVLADFGQDPWTLLECVPNYVNVVASFNAAYTGMMRSFAGLLKNLGRTESAAIADAEADTLARAVIGMSLPGGRWEIRHPTVTEAIGHCLDFGLVAAHLHGDLSETQRSEAVRFVSEKLLASTWMRALAPDDPAAPLSDRPDHGAAGAFGAWPGVTAYGLAKLGRRDLAAKLLSAVHESASGGLWGQAMEIVTDRRGQWVRVAEEGVSNRDSIAGVAIAEAVVSGLFGFEPTFCERADAALPDSIDVPGIGSLLNINVGPRSWAR